MTDPDANAVVTRPPRFLLNENQSARVRLWRHGETDPAECAAELIDISRGGTKLRVSTGLRFEESVRLRIQIPNVGLNCYVLASVRHIRPAGEGRWIVGCAVHPPLDERAVARLATRAAVDRRRSPRLPISLNVSVRRQLGTVDDSAVMLNLSRGGFCVRLHEPCDAGERVRVDIPGTTGDQPGLDARAQWQLSVPGGYMTGCKFLRADGYELVRAAANLQAPNAQEGVPLQVPHGRRSLWPASAMLACAAIAMLVADEGEQARPIRASVPRSKPVMQVRPTVVSNRQAEQPPLDAESPPNPPAPTGSNLESDAQNTIRPRSLVVQRPIIRKWTDSTGEFSVMAALVAVDVDHVTLLRTDGRKVRVPLARLSAADVEFVDALHP